MRTRAARRTCPSRSSARRPADAVALLALVAGQDVEPVEGSDGTDGRWRIAQRVAPDRVISTVDPEARHAHKTVHRRQDGFKAHVAVEPDTGIITDCTLTKASGAPAPTPLSARAARQRTGAGRRCSADSAYGTGEARAVLPPGRTRRSDQTDPAALGRPGGFTIDDFTVDESAGTATCPHGLTRRITRTRRSHLRHRLPRLPTAATLHHQQSRAHPAPARHETLLRAARRQAETGEFQTIYKHHRPMVERTIAWLVRRSRQVRLPRSRQERPLAAPPRRPALNLRRLISLGTRPRRKP